MRTVKYLRDGDGGGGDGDGGTFYRPFAIRLRGHVCGPQVYVYARVSACTRSSWLLRDVFRIWRHARAGPRVIEIQMRERRKPRYALRQTYTTDGRIPSFAISWTDTTLGLYSSRIVAKCRRCINAETTLPAAVGCLCIVTLQYRIENRYPGVQTRPSRN